MNVTLQNFQIKIDDQEVSLEQLVQSYKGSFNKLPAEAAKCYAIYKTDEGPEYMHWAMWHPDTTLNKGERMVSGFFVPDSIIDPTNLQDAARSVLRALTKQGLHIPKAADALLLDSIAKALKQHLPNFDVWEHAVRIACHRTGMEMFDTKDPESTLRTLTSHYEALGTPLVVVDESIPEPEPVPLPLPNEIYKHVDGGFYKFLMMVNDCGDQSPRAIYQHVWPFETKIWDRPYDEWKTRFTKSTEGDVAVIMIAHSREDYQQEITQAKAKRRTKETGILAVVDGKSVGEGDTLFDCNGVPWAASEGQGVYKLTMRRTTSQGVEHVWFVNPYEENGVTNLYWNSPLRGSNG